MPLLKKVTLLGDPAVGKTSLIQRFVHDSFSDSYLSTIGAKPSVKEMGDITLVIWDIAGQKSFGNVSVNYFEGSEGALVVYDVTRPETIPSIAHWISAFKENTGSSNVVVVGNKQDLEAHPDTEEHVAQVLTDMDLIQTGSSAKTGAGVEESFTQLIKGF